MGRIQYAPTEIPDILFYMIFFLDQKDAYAISHNPSSIQIKGRYISHRSLFDKKEGHSVLHELCFDSGKSEYVLQNYILDRKY